MRSWMISAESSRSQRGRMVTAMFLGAVAKARTTSTVSTAEVIQRLRHGWNLGQTTLELHARGGDMPRTAFIYFS